MRYALLLYADTDRAARTTPDEATAELSAYAEIARDLRQAGVLEGGEAFMPADTATLIEVRQGSGELSDVTASDRELSGFLIIACDEDRALDIAGRLPVVEHGAVEVRPLLALPDRVSAGTTPADIAVSSPVTDLGTILGVWAHPDDETYLSAGLMASAADAGQRVACVNATRGEHGTPDPTRWPPDRLARTRKHEIAAAMAVLGVEDHRCLDYEDGTLATLDAAEGVRRVAELIDELEPDTLVTFGPDGMTGHADHRTVCAWTTAAWRTTRPDARLLYATTTAAFVEEHAEIHAELGVFGPGFPVPTPTEDLAWALTLDDALLDRKLAALRCQATQTAPVIAAMGEDAYRDWWRQETFRPPNAGGGLGN